MKIHLLKSPSGRHIRRISVSLLVLMVNSSYVGIIDKKSLFDMEHTKITALGGAAILHDRDMLADAFSAFDFEGTDARFKIPLQHFDQVTAAFRSLDPELFEISPFREIREELLNEAPRLNRILKPDFEPIPLAERDLEKLESIYLGWHEQLTAVSQIKGPATYRLMHCFRIVAPQAIEAKILGQPCLRRLSLTEIEALVTEDRIPIKDNIVDIDRLLKS